MSDALVQVADIEARLGRSLGATADTARATALIADASGQVYNLLSDETAFHAEDGTLDVPAAVVAVVCQVVIRAFDNPRGLSGETIGDYSYQASGAASSGIYLTSPEKRILRRAHGSLGVSTLTLTGDLPVDAWDDYVLPYPMHPTA